MRIVQQLKKNDVLNKACCDNNHGPVYTFAAQQICTKFSCSNGDFDEQSKYKQVDLRKLNIVKRAHNLFGTHWGRQKWRSLTEQRDPLLFKDAIKAVGT